MSLKTERTAVDIVLLGHLNLLLNGVKGNTTVHNVVACIKTEKNK